MNTKLPFRRSLVMLLASLLASQITPVRAATNLWTGASGTDLYWSTPGNWSLSGSPGASDAVQFFTNATVANASTSNNIVSASKVVQSVWFRQTNGGYHNTVINPGATLTLSNTAAANVLLAGTESDVSATYAFTNTIAGAGGTLTIIDTNANSALAIRQPSVTSGAHRATLDMSGLDTFNATVGRLLIAVETSIRRPAGTLLLARTNTIVALGTQGSPLAHTPLPGITLGDGGNNGGNAIVQLGQTNAFFTDSLVVGREKSPGGVLQFNPSFTNTPNNPVAYLRGRTATRIAYFSVGDNSGQQTANTTSTGTADFSGGTLDAQVDQMYLGRGMDGNGGGWGRGTLTFGKGILDVNTLELGYQQNIDATAVSIGTLNVNGTANLLVNGSLRLARAQGGGTGGTNYPAATLNINGGTVAVGGSVLDGGGTNTINLRNGGLLDMQPASATTPGTLSAQTITVGTNGVGTITNAGTISATTLILGAGGSIRGATTINLGSPTSLLGGSNLFDTSALGGGFVLGGTQALQGNGSLIGSFTQGSGATLNPGGSGVAGTLAFSNNLTLQGGKLPLDLSASSSSGNDQITVSGNLTLSGTNDVPLNNLNWTFDTATPYTVISYQGALAGDASYFRLLGPVTQSRYTFTVDTTSTPKAVQLRIGGAGPANLKWVGDGAANTWNLDGAPNWNNGVGSDKFFNLDVVVFDDTGSAAPAVNLVGTLIPASLTMNNAAKPYTFAGTGSLVGGTLTHSGPGNLTVANSGTNSFRDSVTVLGGGLTFTNSSQNTFRSGMILSGGSTTFTGACSNDFGTGGLTVWNGATGIVANAGQNFLGSAPQVNGTLIFSQPVNSTVASALNGSGTVIKDGTSILTLAGNDSGLFSPVLVIGGTLRAGAGNALPTMGVVLTNGTGTLDVNGFNLGSAPITASGVGAGGQGAIVNNNGNPNYVNPNLNSVTLVGDTTIGGTGRWDLRSPAGTTGDPATAFLSAGGQPYNLTKVGTNVVAFVSATIDPVLGDISVRQGGLQFEGNTTSLGDPGKTLTLEMGTTLLLYRTTNLWNKQFVFNGDGTNDSINNLSWTNAIVGPVTLNGVCLFNGGGNYLTNAGPMSGSGSLVKLGSHTIVLAGASAYSGSTTISNGILAVDGSLAGSGVAVSGGNLAGTGSITAPVIVNVGGTLSPAGSATGTLTVTSTLTLGGTSQFDIAKSGGSFANDLVQNVSTLTYGGTLQLNLTGDPLAAGDSIKLFAATTYAGAFASIVPATPGPGLVWVTSQLNSGTLRVATPPPVIDSVKLTSGNLILSGTGGTPGASYSVLSTTNIIIPLNLWTPVGGGTFGPAGQFSYTNAVAPNTPQQFFRLLQ